MSNISVSTAQHLYSLKETSENYNEITVDVHQLKQQGLVRHAVKYSLNALVDNGTLIINSSPFVSYHFRKNAIDFWQVKYEVFNCLKDAVEIVEVNPKAGRLVLRKKKHLYDYNGVSFGIVFSGNKSEEEQLIASIHSIPTKKNIPVEVLICGPTGYDASSIISKFPSTYIKYLPLDISTSPRLMICDKKNLLFSSAVYDLVVISHCRILFTETFISQLVKYPVEMATPAVYFTDDNKEFKYLDIGFIDSYQDVQFGAKRGTIAGENITADYLHWYRNRVPYIDGGLNIFNKKVIFESPYNKHIAWGEAEDVDVCNRLFQDGILIDYLPSIKTYSATNKLTGYNVLKAIGRKFFRYLNKKGITVL